MIKVKQFIIILVMLSVFVGCSNKLPKDYIEHLNLSQTYIESEDYNGALLEIEKAMEINSNAPEAYVQKGYIHLVRNEMNQANEVLSYVEEHMSEFKEEQSQYSGLLNVGNLKYQQGKFEEALSFFEKAVLIDKTDSVVYNSIGLCYVALNEKEKAKEAYSTTIDLDYQNFYAYGNLASLFLSEGEFDRGLSEINTALGINQYIPQFYLIKGELLSGKNQINEAIDTYNEAINLWENFGDAYYQRGDSYLALEDYLNAAKDFSLANEYGIDAGLLGLGYAYNGLGQYNDAINAFTKYMGAIDSIDLRALYEIAIGYYNLENYTESINAIDELLKLEPEDSEALLIKAFNYEKLNQYTNAKEILELIISIDPEHEKALEELQFLQENDLR